MDEPIRSVIETPRLRLREMTLADVDFVAGMLADPAVMRFYPKIYSRREAEEWVLKQRMRYRDHGHGLWLAVEATTREPVGQVGLVRQEVEGRPEEEIGYLLAASCWGRGYATEAARATRDHAFRVLRKDRVISLIRPENVPSQRVAQRIDFTVRSRTLFGGFEHLVFGMERSQWLPLADPPVHGRVT
ncbi:MAG TPA: GNAT family N-acetyltransferase [Vicinamibacteria bacterium]|nr:GNAT family N-acetyltransferase [Vicinamibacteria bacterium]